MIQDVIKRVQTSKQDMEEKRQEEFKPNYWQPEKKHRCFISTIESEFKR